MAVSIHNHTLKSASITSKAQTNALNNQVRVNFVTPPNHKRLLRTPHRSSTTTLVVASASDKAASLNSAAAIDMTTALRTLRNAGTAQKPDPADVEAALQKFAGDGADVKAFPECVSGTWKLVFALPAPIPAWKYIPVREEVDIDVDAGTVALKSWLGPFEFEFGGRAKFVKNKNVGQYDMDFSFSTTLIKCFGKVVKEGTREAKERTYSFFFVTSDVAAVRSSQSGGLTLMVRP